MSVYGGPANVTNGLIFEIDITNSQKSWKGKPATNLLLNSQDFSTNWSGNLFNNWINSTVSTNVSTAPDGTITADRLTGYYSRWTDSIAASVSTTYTFSCYLKNYNLSDPPYLHVAFGLNGTLVNYNNVTSVPIANISDWSRYSITVTSPSSGINQIQCGIEFGASKSASAGPYAVDVWGAQLETGSLVTPYIPTTSSSASRSTTQSIVDLTGQNTLTASSLTYNSDGTYSFNGSSDYLIIPENSSFNTQTPTVEVWVKTNATTQNGFWFEKGQVNTQYALFQEGANITWRHTTNVGSLTAPCASYMNTTQYAQVVGTYTAGDRRIYVNGVQVASDALNYSLPTNANGSSIGVYGGYNGGRGYYYNGNIAIVKVYNRALSSAEVQQNFQAQRSRFGI